MAIITIESYTLQNWNYSHDTVELRIFANQYFVSLDGEVFQPASFDQPDGIWYQSVECNPDLDAHTLLIPSFTLQPTTNAQPNNCSYSLAFFSGPAPDGQVIVSFAGLTNTVVGTSPLITNIPALINYNGQPAQSNLFSYYWVFWQLAAQFNAGELIPDGETVPSVLNHNTFFTGNTSPTNITDFVNFYNQQIIGIFIGDTNTSIFGIPRDNNTFLLFGHGVDGQWHEIVSGALGIQTINGNANTAQLIVIGTDGSVGDAPSVVSSGGTTTVNVPVATQVITGTVTPTTQTFAGIKIFTGPVTGQTNVTTPTLILGNGSATGAEELQFPNDAGGTTQNRLAKLVSGKAALATTADTAGIIGPVQGPGGTTGVCTIAVAGVGQCAADSAWTAGNFAIPSVTDDGKVHDAGSARPTTAQTIGRFTDTGGSAGNAHLLVFGPEIVYGGSGGGGGSNWGVFNPIDYGAVGDGAINDTTAFLTMLTAIGSEIATVIIPKTANGVSQFLLGNITFPSNVTLDFFPGGAIKVVTARTVLIQGLIIAQPIQIFFNVGTVAAALGLVSFGNTSPTNSTDGFTPQQKDYWAEWWGAIGDNVTHSAAFLDAAFEALPNGCAMYLAGKFYYLEHGITFGYKVSCSLIGNATEAGISGNLDKPIFVYQGTAGGTAFTAVNTYSCTFHGFGIYGSNGSGDVAHQAATNFFLTELAGGVPSIVSHCYLTGLTLWALSVRTDWIGILINNGGGGADGNNEHHTIRECEFVGQQSLTSITPQQAGINFGQSQIQRVIIERCNFSGLSVGVLIGGGNFLAYNNVFGNIGTPWYLNSPNDNCLVMGDDIENAGRLVTIASTNGPFTLTFMAGKYGGIGGGTNVGSSDARTTAPIRIVSAGDISFYNCNLNNAGTLGQDFGPYLVGGPDNGVGAVEFYNCLIGTATNINIYAPGFATCSTRFVKGELDLRWGGDTNANISLLSAAPPTKGSLRPIIELKGPTATTPADPLTLGGAYGISGLYPIGLVTATSVGVTGSTLYHLTVIGVDSAGRRTGHKISDFLSVADANATLSGSNYITITWYSLSPTPDHYEVWDVDTGNSSQWRKIANVTPTGAVIETYNIVLNPSGSYVLTQPPYNEAGIANLRNLTLYPIDTQFTDGDTTPSVAVSNDYYTANSTATTITNFDNPSLGQVIRVRIDDANTTIANNSTIITGSGLNIIGIQGVVYSFVYRGTAWHNISTPIPADTLLATVAGVDMNTATPTSLFTVPSGRICIVTRVVVRNASTSLTTVQTSWGWNSASFNDWETAFVLAALTTSANFRLIIPLNGAKIGTAGQIFKALNTVLQGGAATTTMDVFGYLTS